jgi:hypothetical protein
MAWILRLLRNAPPLLASLLLPAASQAQLKLEPPRVDFGERGQNERPETTVILRNLGTAPLTLKDIKKSCDCLGFSPDRFTAPIPAGGQTELKITMGSGRAMGRLEKHLTILTSSTSQPEVSLPVSMSVLDGFEMEPRGVTLFGLVGGPPERAEVAIKLRRGARPQRVDLAIKEVRSVFGRPSGRHLRASAASGEGGSRLAIELDPAHPEGPISAEIEATLNGRTLVIPVNGEMFAWIKISPNTINFSRALEEDPASTVRELTLTSADATPFKILKIESRPRRPDRPGESAVKLEFSVEPPPSPEGGGPWAQKLRCRASREGGALVTFDGTVTIRTDHPKKPEIVLKYSGLFAESQKSRKAK